MLCTHLRNKSPLKLKKCDFLQVESIKKYNFFSLCRTYQRNENFKGLKTEDLDPIRD